MEWTGKRAPSLRRSKEPTWAEPISIFNGKDLSGWKADRNKNQWMVKNGILTNPESGANLITEETFEDFKLEVEFRFPEKGNSGIFLRGRYEVQVEDSKNEEPGLLDFAGVYGFISANEFVSNGPGEWNKYEITLIGRTLTVIANGKSVITNQVIPGITGGAIDSEEGNPGPIMLQGDHTDVEFRKIILTPATY